MTRDDEKALYHYMRTTRPIPGIKRAVESYFAGKSGAHIVATQESVEDAFDRFNIPHKRGYYLLDKWDRKGWWDYGVSLRSGWFTTKAPDTIL